MRMPWSFLQSAWPVLREAAGSSPSVMAAVKESKGQRGSYDVRLWERHYESLRQPRTSSTGW